MNTIFLLRTMIDLLTHWTDNFLKVSIQSHLTTIRFLESIQRIMKRERFRFLNKTYLNEIESRCIDKSIFYFLEEKISITKKKSATNQRTCIVRTITHEMLHFLLLGIHKRSLRHSTAQKSLRSSDACGRIWNNHVFPFSSWSLLGNCFFA